MTFEADEEKIEPENEEDRAFLDDEFNKNDSLFYRRLNVELNRNRRQEVTAKICCLVKRKPVIIKS